VGWKVELALGGWLVTYRNTEIAPKWCNLTLHTSPGCYDILRNRKRSRRGLNRFPNVRHVVAYLCVFLIIRLKAAHLITPKHIDLRLIVRLVEYLQNTAYTRAPYKDRY